MTKYVVKKAFFKLLLKEYMLEEDNMKIYFVRHGETINNKEKIFNGGSVNPDLTEKGQLEARNLGNYLQNIKFDECFSSPLKRAYSTAQIILGENRLIIPKIRTMQDLTEMNLGDWDGKSIAGLENEPQTKNYFESPAKFDAVSIHAESYLETQRRGYYALQKIYQKSNGKENILVTSHGLFLNTVLKTLIGIPLNDIRKTEMLPTCSVTEFDVSNYEKFKLINWGFKP